MAAKPKHKPLSPELEEAPKSDWEALAEWVIENPALTAVIAGFALLCILAGLLYRASADSRDLKATTEYARALSAEDAALRESQLAPVADTSSRWTAEALYMMGEAAYEARDFAKAKEAFSKLRQEHADTAYAPDAVEGLGYLAENEGDFQGALTTYQEVKTKWANSFAAMRQDLNIGRCQEQLGNLADAVKSYEAEVASFPESAVSAKAQEALDRIKTAHPELFPEPVAEQAPAAPAEAPGTEAVPSPKPEVTTPQPAASPDSGAPAPNAAAPAAPSPAAPPAAPASQ